MGVIASGPPFDLPAKTSVQICKCGWMLAGQCRMDDKCGLNQGMPEYKEEYHTPYEFLPDRGTDWEWGPGSIIDLNKVCREVVEDLVKDSKSTQVGGTHYESMPLQPWEVFRKTNTTEGYCTYHINTVMAYLMRHDKKGGLVDLKKAADHLRELIRYFEEEQEYPW